MICYKLKDIFSIELGTIKNEKSKTYYLFKSKKYSKIFKAWPVPCALKQKIELELVIMVKSNILEPVDVSERATYIAPATKKDSSIQISWDYKITVKEISLLDNNTIPKIDIVYWDFWL